MTHPVKRNLLYICPFLLFLLLGTGISVQSFSNVQKQAGVLSTAHINPTPDPASVLTAAIGAVSNCSCYGGNNGAATVIVSGGTPPYQYSWSNGQLSVTAFGLAAGRYKVTVRDSLSQYAIDSVTITQPNLLSDSLVTKAVSCQDSSNGRATMNPKGGTAPYNYSWSTNPPQTTQTAVGLPPGSYSAVITDFNGCITDTNCLIIQPAGYIKHVTAGCNRKLTALDSGGTGYYSWYWNTTPVQTTQSITVSVTGTYSVLVLDSISHCLHTDSITIIVPEQPPVPVITLVGASLVSSVPVGDQWYLSGVPIAGAHDSLFNPSVNGTYTVRVGVPPCTSVSAPYVLTSAGIVTHSESEIFFDLYPNPATGPVVLEFGSDNKEMEWDLIVYNGIGKEIINRRPGSSSPQKLTIDFSDLSNGIYFISIRNKTGDRGGRKKLVIQH